MFVVSGQPWLCPAVVMVAFYGCHRRIGVRFSVAVQLESPPHERFLVGCSSPFVRLAEQLHGASRLVLAISGWSVKNTDVLLPGIVECEGLWSYDYGHA